MFLLYRRAAHARSSCRGGQRVETTSFRTGTCVGPAAQKGRYLPPLRCCLCRPPLSKRRVTAGYVIYISRDANGNFYVRILLLVRHSLLYGIVLFCRGGIIIN